MHESHEVISAFIDGEPFEPEQLTAALADPVGRALLIDLLALRQLAQVDVPAAAVARRGRTALRLAMAAAAVVVALAGGYRWGVSTSTAAAVPPEPSRVLNNVGAWQEGGLR
jgi:hypothetical protein